MKFNVIALFSIFFSIGSLYPSQQPSVAPTRKTSAPIPIRTGSNRVALLRNESQSDISKFVNESTTPASPIRARTRTNSTPPAQVPVNAD